jgi:YD repeat-containing protein
VEDSLGSISQYEYDKIGQLTKQTDANGNNRTWQYNLNGQMTNETMTGCHKIFNDQADNSNTVQRLETQQTIRTS